MSTTKPELLAAYWTIAGDTYPGAPSEISPFSLQERVEAAAQAGWTGMGLVHADLMHNVEKMGYAGMRRIFEANGIRHIEVEFLNDWFLPASDPLRKASDAMRSDLLACAGELGARNLKCCGTLFDEGAPNVPLIRDEFSKLCEDARKVDTNVVIEMMPFSNIRNIDDAMAVIAGADQSNGGLLIDIWHIARGGMPYSEISKVPAKFLKGIELNDAMAEVIGRPFDDSRYRRVRCGEGSFDFNAFLSEVKAVGFDAPYYGVEIISETLRKLPLEVQAKTIYDTTIKQFELLSA